MNAKHTPGPWSRNWIYGAIRHINKNVDFDAFICDEDPEWIAIQDGTLHYPDPRCNPGDTDLIAASPELLDVCKRLISCDIHDDIDSVISQAREAIAKATGEVS